MRESEYIYLTSRPHREGERGRGRTGWLGVGGGGGGVNALTRESTAEKDPYDFIGRRTLQRDVTSQQQKDDVSAFVIFSLLPVTTELAS